jgi:hypothetical protein
MNVERKSSESGQAIVLIALTFVVLLGFTALAVDGSMVYSDRRFAQNSTDASSLAGGGVAALEMENRNITYLGWPCNVARTSTIPGDLAYAASAARDAAIDRAADNDFIIDEDISDKHGVITECGVDYSNPLFPDKYLDVTTNITIDTDTAFAHFVYRGIMRNSVEAVTRVRPRSPLAFGRAIVALNESTCQGQQNGAGFHGSNTVYVDGGGIFSNGCMSQDGNGPHFDVTVVNGSIDYRYKDNNDDFSVFSPTPQVHNTVMPPSSYQIDPPNCSDPNAHNLAGSDFEDEAEDGLNPGLYCVSGDISFSGNGSFSGNEVTIVLLNGGLRITGNPLMEFSAPTAANPAPAVRGLLIYAPQSNHNEIHLGGTANSAWTGTVLAPGADIELSGTSSNVAFNTQIIGYNVKVGGTSDTLVTYQGGQQAMIAAAIDLWE